VTAALALAVAAAACFGLALVLTQFGLRHMSAADGALISIPTTALLFWALAPFVLELGAFELTAAAIFAGVGLFFPAAVTLLTYEANQRLGPTVAGALGGTAPLFAALAAMLFLGERPTALTAAATLAVVAGIAVLGWQPARWPVRFLLLPLAAALLRGLAQVAIKAGLALWPSAFAASLVGYSASVLSVAADARLRRGAARGRFDRRGAAWFALVGFGNGAAVLSMYAALARGAVTLVAPMASYPLFALLLGALLLKEQRITPRLAAGTALMVAGIAALILGRAG